MKTKAIFFIILSFCFTLNTQAEENPAFKPGEKLEYNMYYNLGFIWIQAARVKFEVKDVVYNKEPAYKLAMTGETAKTFSVFYFKDTTLTYIDKETILPYYAYQASHESKYYSRDKYYFNKDTSDWKVIVETQTSKKHKLDTIETTKPFYDLLTTLYKLRSTDVSNLQKDQKLPMPMIFNDGTYDLYLRYVGKETIKLKNGKKYNCLKMKPLLAEGKVFEKGEGMTIWISDDKNHIPMMIESKLKIGSIKASLHSIANNAHPMTSEVAKK